MTAPDPYAAHRAFTAPARDGSRPWQVAAGLALSELAFSLSPLLLFPIFGTGAQEVLDGRTPGALFLSLTLYCVPALVIVAWVRTHHRRPGWSLTGPPAAALRDLRRVAWAVFLALLAIEVLPPTIDPAGVAAVRPLPLWLASLPLACIAVLVQSGSEEVVFRGYIQQQFAAISERPMVWMVLPSALFGALHFWNADGAADGVLWAVWAFFLGMACADLTARTGTIGAAIGLHATNNLFIFALFGMEGGPDSGFALFLYDYAEPVAGPGIEALASPWAAFDVALSAAYVLVMWLAARIALRQ